VAGDRRRLAGQSDVTAIFCGNDEIAMGVIRGLADEGLSVPGDVSVVGFDDHPLAELWSPSLTTVRQDFAGLGARALGLLRDELEHPEQVGKLSNERPELILRDSSAPPRRRRYERSRRARRCGLVTAPGTIARDPSAT
jgi:DNA-binding LacI/PurR family transcriptional regulator